MESHRAFHDTPRAIDPKATYTQIVGEVLATPMTFLRAETSRSRRPQDPVHPPARISLKETPTPAPRRSPEERVPPFRPESQKSAPSWKTQNIFGIMTLALLILIVLKMLQFSDFSTASRATSKNHELPKTSHELQTALDSTAQANVQISKLAEELNHLSAAMRRDMNNPNADFASNQQASEVERLREVVATLRKELDATLNSAQQNREEATAMTRQIKQMSDETTKLDLLQHNQELNTPPAPNLLPMLPATLPEASAKLALPKKPASR